MKYLNKSIIALHTVILAFFLLCFFLIPHDKYASTWIAFSFSIVAIIVSCIVTSISFNDKSTILSRIYGLPIFRIGYLYLIIQMVVGIVIYFLDVKFEVPYWITLLVCVFLLFLALVGVVAAVNTRQIIEKVDDETRQSIAAAKYFRVELDDITRECRDDALRQKLMKLSEAFRYSDPVSSDATAQLESDIVAAIETLRLDVMANRVDNAENMVDAISRKLAHRNDVCKTYKSMTR
ncbi:MAG: hypothetical protein IJL52_11235 [Clostridia bacterium]|nr:hypothetical protein [Clostridia bacterium]